MRLVAVLALWLGLTSSSLAAPSAYLNNQYSNGQYSFVYSEPMSSRSEYRDSQGMTRGSYSYIDSYGLLQTSDYEAGPDSGFFVKATNLPQAPLPVKEAPEVLIARQKHLQLLEQANRREDNERALPANDQAFTLVSDSSKASGHMTAKSKETIPMRKEEIPKGSLQFDEPAVIKEEPQKELIPDFVPLPKSDAKLLSVPKDRAILLKSDANSVSLPKVDSNFLTLPKSDARFLSFSKSDTTLLSLLKGDSNILPLPTEEAKKMASILPFKSPLQRGDIFLPKPVEYTPEVAAAREAHLRAVAEAASKSAEPVKDTPEVIAAREAHLRAALEPDSAIPIVSVKYTPEVQAARDAHFRAFEAAAKLAAASDANPKILEQVLRNPSGAIKQSEPKIGGLEPVMLATKSADEIVRLMGKVKSEMKVESPAMRDDAPKEDSPVITQNRIVANLAERPQIKQAVKTPEVKIVTGITPAGTSLRISDSRLPLLNEFEQSKLKADTGLTCSTDLKVKNLDDIKPMDDRRLLFIKSGEFVPVLSTDHLPITKSPHSKNWAVQFTYF